MTETQESAMKMALEALEATSCYDIPSTSRVRTAIATLRAALAEPVQEPVRCPLCNYQYGHQIGCENNPVDIALAAAQPRQPAEPVQEPVAVYQWRKQGCADWYDGHPDYSDCGGPYETRTLYTAPAQRKSK